MPTPFAIISFCETWRGVPACQRATVLAGTERRPAAEGYVCRWRVCWKERRESRRTKTVGTRAALHVKTLIGVTCSETSYGRTVPTFHGSHATSNTYNLGGDCTEIYFIPAKQFVLRIPIVSLIFPSFLFSSPPPSSLNFESTRCCRKRCRSR